MWQLIINGPGYFDTLYDLTEGVTTLGRADENDIVLAGEAVSRKHLRITVAAGALSVEDLGSRNGSKLNNDPLNGTATLKAGDVLHIGENALTIRELAGRSKSSIRRLNTSENIERAVLAARRAN